MTPTSDILAFSGVLAVVQALEGQALPPLVEGESLPLKEVELHQVGDLCLSDCLLVCLSACLSISAIEAGRLTLSEDSGSMARWYEYSVLGGISSKR